MILFWSLQIFGVTVSPPTVGASGWFPWLWEEFQLFVLWVAFPPVPNSRAITWRMLEPALPASRCQIVTLPLAITQPRCVLRLRSPVSWLTLFPVSQQHWSCSFQLLRSSCKPKVTHSLHSLACPPAHPVSLGFLPTSGPPGIWTISAHILHLLWTLSQLRPPVLTGTDWVCFWVQTTLL